MNFYAIPNFLAAIFEILLGIFIISRNKNLHINFPFFLLIFATFIWQASTGFVIASNSEILGLTITRIGFFGIFLIPIAMYHLTVRVLAVDKNKLLLSGYLLAFFIILPLSWTPLILDGVYKYKWGFFYKAGRLHPVFMVYFVYFMLVVLYNLFIDYRQEKNQLERNRKKYFFLALFIACIGAIDFLPTYGVNVYPFGYIAVIVCTLIFTYAIYRYSLLDIKVAITRASIFVIVYAVVLFVPFIFGYYSRGLLSDVFGIHWWITPVFLMAILSTSGPFIYTYFQRKAEQRIRFEEFRAHQQLNNLAQNMMRFTDLELLLKLIVHELVKIMKVTSAYVYLKEQGNTHYGLKSKWSVDSSTDKQTEFSEDSALVRDILLRRTPIILEELKFDQTKHSLSHIKAIRDQLQKVKASVVIPAFKGDYLFGLLILGPRRNNRIFTQEDLNLLMLLASQAVLAIENAQLFEREKLYLAEKSRRDALADMAPGVSHQFNNRFIAINSEMQACLDLLGQKPLEGLSREEILSLFENFKEFGKLIIEDTVKGREIAQAIMKKGKADLSFTETYLTPVIENSIRLLKLSRTRASLEGSTEPEIALDIEKDLSKIVLSVSLMEDVFYNLVDNARDAITIKNRYIKEGKLNFKGPFSGKIIISAARQDKAIIIKIQDNGIGIEKDKIKRLFSPFFTSKATAHKGTGMGLYVIQGMIEQHKGKISVESEYEKGTTFTIELPTGQGRH
jgi:signal transduction histidine kinase